MNTQHPLAIWSSLESPGSMADVIDRANLSQTIVYTWLRRMVRDELLERSRSHGVWTYSRCAHTQRYDVERMYGDQNHDLHVPMVWARDVFDFAARLSS